MGYYTSFEILKIDDPDNHFGALLDDIEDVTGGLVKQGYSEDIIKWYNHTEDCRKLSMKFPNLLFVVEGIGEYSDDRWREYFLNGKTHYMEPEWPEFHREYLV